MAEIHTYRTIEIKAETVGDIAKWLNAVQDSPSSTPLLEPVHLSVRVDEPEP